MNDLMIEGNIASSSVREEPNRSEAEADLEAADTGGADAILHLPTLLRSPLVQHAVLLVSERKMEIRRAPNYNV